MKISSVVEWECHVDVPDNLTRRIDAEHEEEFKVAMSKGENVCVISVSEEVIETGWMCSGNTLSSP